jgi:hypothetical protein
MLYPAFGWGWHRGSYGDGAAEGAAEEAVKAEEKKDRDTKKAHILPLIALYDHKNALKLYILAYAYDIFLAILGSTF